MFNKKKISNENLEYIKKASNREYSISIKDIVVTFVGLSLITMGIFLIIFRLFSLNLIEDDKWFLSFLIVTTCSYFTLLKSLINIKRQINHKGSLLFQKLGLVTLSFIFFDVLITSYNGYYNDLYNSSLYTSSMIFIYPLILFIFVYLIFTTKEYRAKIKFINFYYDSMDRETKLNALKNYTFKREKQIIRFTLSVYILIKATFSTYFIIQKGFTQELIIYIVSNLIYIVIITVFILITLRGMKELKKIKVKYIIIIVVSSFILSTFFDIRVKALGLEVVFIYVFCCRLYDYYFIRNYLCYNKVMEGTE